MSAADAPRCGACRWFRNDAAYLEQQMPGLQSLSSGFGTVRGDDGLCAVHQRYVPAGSHCAQFLRQAPREPAPRPGASAAGE